MNMMKEIRPLVYLPSPSQSKKVAEARLKWHDQAYHTESKLPRRGRPPEFFPYQWHYRIWKKKNPKDRRRWLYEGHTVKDDKSFLPPVPSDAILVDEDSMITMDEADYEFFNQTMVKQIIDRKRQRQYRKVKASR